MKKMIKVLGLIFLAFVIFWLYSYFSCELKTFKHGNEFKNLYSETGIINSVDYLKVLDYSDDAAKIYYVSKNTGGNIVYFMKLNNKWHLKNWASVWSKYGNADNIVWPYIK